ncbi:ROK family glucokinase [Bacillus xiapuensis]|uniref:ROK family glucokinase n=1 Tax=Bacillus xiapuensis TaxID=2014075 RepID=UPI000C237DC0|nr:ROK family glucokinase [Bacillus xiapuensis]
MAEQWIAAVDLGGTTTKLAFITESGDLAACWEIPTDTSDKGKRIIANIVKSIHRQLERMNVSKERIIGIGMGAPGPISDEGVMLTAVNLGWDPNYPIKERLEKESKLPVAVENDAKCAALGEMWKGAGAGARDLVCVTLGTGVGGGIIANGEIVRGKGGVAGEIGHVTVVLEDGERCNCGKSGCLETVASATGLVRLANKQLQATTEASVLREKRSFNSRDVFQAANEGDKVAKQVIDHCCRYLGLALSYLGNSLNPEKIVIGGGVSKAGAPLLQSIRSYFEEFAFEPVKATTAIDLAVLGNQAGVIGAAWLIKKKMLTKQSKA